MYIPKPYRVKDIEKIEKFIKENSFATLISQGEKFPYATSIPIELELNEKGEKVLWGHLSKANFHAKLIEENPNVLVVYLSPIHHYISSSWYKNPDAPTWNYISIQISGTIEVINGEKAWESVRRLTDKYERISKCPISLDTLPRRVQQQMNGLVAFEIKIENIEAAFKLSQNRNDEDYQNIISELYKLNDPISEQMANTLKQNGTEKEKIMKKNK